MPAAAEFDSAALTSSLRAAGVWISPDAFTLAPCEGMGVGAVAARGLESGTPLFHLPLSALLTPWTSALRGALCTSPNGASADTTAWDDLAPHGWARLMLAMMYEESRGDASPWAAYLANMPREFDTPIWWSEQDLALLKGTDIADRIGKTTADEQYTTVIAPLLASRPDLFGGDRESFFSLHNYHVQGSRILSRSFTVPVSRAGGPPKPEGEGEDDDSDDEEDEDDTVAVMVPMADMLNAAYGRNNARLFADDDDDDEVPDADAQQFGEGYTMITTQAVPSGEQIFNTYASPPNAELLRKYGYVDEPELPPHILAQLNPDEVGAWPRGNAADEVEVPGDLLVAAAGNADSLRDRVDFWLEEGQEDTFWLPYPDAEDSGADSLPPALVAFARLLSSDEAWARAQRKGKLPNPSLDAAAAQLLLDAIDARAAKYPQSISDDLAVVTTGTPGNAHNAAAVRLGEKRVLGVNRRIVASELDRLRQSANGRDHPTDDDRASKRRK